MSFGSDGEIYSKLSAFNNESNEYKIDKPCSIKLISKENNSREIVIYPNTGYNKQIKVNE